MGGGRFGDDPSKPMGSFGEVQDNCGDALNAIRDESGESRMKIPTGGGCFGEQGGHFGDGPSKPMGCFGEVQVDINNGGDALNAIRGEYREVTVMMSTQENSFQEIPA